MNKKLIITVLIITLVLVIASALLFYFRANIIDNLKKWELIPEPEPYTEIYFENHTKLPIVLSNSPQSFSFTIHNVEYKNMNYKYEVYIKTGNNILVLDKKVNSIKTNMSKTINETFKISTSSATDSEVIVNLINKNEQIDFWVRKSLLE